VTAYRLAAVSYREAYTSRAALAPPSSVLISRLGLYTIYNAL